MLCEGKHNLRWNHCSLMFFINHGWTQSFLAVRYAIQRWTALNQTTSLFHTTMWKTCAGPATGTPMLGHPSPSARRLSCSHWLCWWECWLFRMILRPEATLSAAVPQFHLQIVFYWHRSILWSSNATVCSNVKLKLVRTTEFSTRILLRLTIKHWLTAGVNGFELHFQKAALSTAERKCLKWCFFLSFHI